MSRAAVGRGRSWVPHALGLVMWVATYFAAVVAYGLLVVVLAEPLVGVSAPLRDAVFAVLVALVLIAATLVASVVVRHRLAGVPWWLLALPALVAGWGVLTPPADEPTWPALVTAVVGLAGSSAVVWLMRSRAPAGARPAARW